MPADPIPAEEILPCPWRGGEVVLTSWSIQPKPWYAVRCFHEREGLRCWQGPEDYDKATAIAAWNRVARDAAFVREARELSERCTRYEKSPDYTPDPEPFV